VVESQNTSAVIQHAYQENRYFKFSDRKYLALCTQGVERMR